MQEQILEKLVILFLITMGIIVINSFIKTIKINKEAKVKKCLIDINKLNSINMNPTINPNTTWTSP